MGMMLDVTCGECGYGFAYFEGCGMTPFDLDSEVAKKRKAIREQVAKLKPLIVPEGWGPFERRLYRCGHCESVHVRLEISFEYQDSEGLHAYVADEICPKCRRPLLQLQPFDPFPCPECKQGEMKTTESGIWD